MVWHGARLSPHNLLRWDRTSSNISWMSYHVLIEWNVTLPSYSLKWWLNSNLRIGWLPQREIDAVPIIPATCCMGKTQSYWLFTHLNGGWTPISTKQCGLIVHSVEHPTKSSHLLIFSSSSAAMNLLINYEIDYGPIIMKEIAVWLIWYWHLLSTYPTFLDYLSSAIFLQ